MKSCVISQHYEATKKSAQTMPTDNEPMIGTLYVNGLEIGEFEISAVDIETNLKPLEFEIESTRPLMIDTFIFWDLLDYIEAFRDALFGGSVWRKE